MNDQYNNTFHRIGCGCIAGMLMCVAVVSPKNENPSAGAAESALRTDTSLRAYYDGLRAKGVGDKDGKVALARKIAALCLCLLKNNDKFKNDYDEQQTRRTLARKELNLEAV